MVERNSMLINGVNAIDRDDVRDLLKELDSLAGGDRGCRLGVVRSLGKLCGIAIFV